MENNQNSQNQGGNNPNPVVPNLDDVTGAVDVTGQQADFSSTEDEDKDKDKDKKPLKEGDEGWVAADDINTIDPTDLPEDAPRYSEETESILNRMYSSEETDVDLQKEALESFGGTKFDEKGNIVNDEGKVTFTAENFAKYIEDGEIPTDEEGNQVNALGDILMSAEEVAKTNSIVYSTKNTLQEQLGIDFTDENGNEIEYKDTEEGIFNMVQDAIVKKTGNTVRDFLNNNPEIKDVFQHLHLGGTMKDYQSNSINYKNIDVDNLSPDQQAAYVEKSLKEQGVQDPSSMINLLKKAGGKELESEAAKAILNLDRLQQEKNQQRDQQIEQKAKQEEQETMQYWNDVKKIVDTGKLDSITIPTADREEFFKFLAIPADAQGRSKDQIAQDKETEETKLMSAYLRFKGGDIAKLAELKAREKRVTTLKERQSRQSQKVTSGQTSNTRASNRPFLPSLEKLGI